MARKITVLIVDDSALVRQIFTEMLSADPDIEVLGSASDPVEAREKIKLLNPDVLTLDIEMPKMDGLSFLEKIMALRPMPVVMASTLTERGAEATLRALEIGAVDYLCKPGAHQNMHTLSECGRELVAKVKMAAQAKVRPAAQVRLPRPLTLQPLALSHVKLIAVGASTGGVEALRELLCMLPGSCPPVVIVQHMPPRFTTTFAERLDKLSEMWVHEAQNNMQLKPGNAYIAPGGMHMRLVRSGTELACKTFAGADVSGHQPSVDVLFDSVAELMGDKAVGVLLTGMGKDGAKGLLNIRNAGGMTIGQDAATCVVYGMPAAAKRLGAVMRELPLPGIAEEIVRQCQTTVLRRA